MRRVFLATLCVLLLRVVVADAVELDLSGRYFVEHYNVSNETLGSLDSSDDYTSMELLVKPILTINENIKLTVELTALQGHIWGTDAQPKFQTDNPLLPAIDSGNNLDWKAAYVTLRTKIGGFLIGRGIEKKWGTGLGDSTGSHGSNSKHKDGIIWVVPVGNFISGLGWQHILEADKGHLVSDADFDKTYIFSAYKRENWHTGLLLARYDHKNFVTLEELREFQYGYSFFQESVADYRRASAVFGAVYRASEQMEKDGYYEEAGLTLKAKKSGYDSVTKWELENPGRQVAEESGGLIELADLNALMIHADVAQALATSAGARIKDGPERSSLSLCVFDPYLIGDFGLLRVEAELLYGWGKVELDRPKLASDSGDLINTVDIEALAGTVGIWGNIEDGLLIGTGATYVQGDKNSYSDGKFSGIGYLEPSIDFERGFLLTSDVSRIGSNFGGCDDKGIELGNLAGGPLTIAGTTGYRMLWIESEYALSSKVGIKILCVSSHADDVPEGWDSDQGFEYDLAVSWKIMDNLSFDGTIAYLDAGDYWKAGDEHREISDTTAVHGRLTIEF